MAKNRDAAYLTQRGATYLFNPDGKLLDDQHCDRNILGFAQNMNDPLSFIREL